MTKMSKILRKAGDVIRERGHCKGALEDEVGSVCFNGALNVAIHGSPMFPVPIRSMETYEFAAIPVGSNYDAIKWNNYPYTTKEEVMQVLDAAYILALQEEGEDDLTDYEEL